MNFLVIQTMEENNYTGLIPDNETGKKINAEAAVTLRDNNEAQAFYNTVKDRLLHVNDWHRIAGTTSAGFKVVDAQGEEVNRMVQQGDYLRIDIPGPGSKAGDGYDWVRVEEIKEVAEAAIESIAMLVRPSPDPQDSNERIAHFYSDASTSTFTVTREKNKVTAGIYDRNIQPNEETKGATDKARNAAVGIGAKLGFSKLQWQALAEAFVKREEA